MYSIEVAAREKDDLNEDPIIVRLRKVRDDFLGLGQRDLLLTLYVTVSRQAGPVTMAFNIL